MKKNKLLSLLIIVSMLNLTASMFADSCRDYPWVTEEQWLDVDFNDQDGLTTLDLNHLGNMIYGGLDIIVYSDLEYMKNPDNNIDVNNDG